MAFIHVVSMHLHFWDVRGQLLHYTITLDSMLCDDKFSAAGLWWVVAGTPGIRWARCSSVAGLVVRWFTRGKNISICRVVMQADIWQWLTACPTSVSQPEVENDENTWWETPYQTFGLHLLREGIRMFAVAPKINDNARRASHNRGNDKSWQSISSWNRNWLPQ